MTVEPVIPSQGHAVLHLFFHLRRDALEGAGSAARDYAARIDAFDQRDGYQVLAFSVVGQKADFGLMVLGPDMVELDRFAGKALTARAFLYPMSIVVIPIGWALRGRKPPYPHLADLFLVLPFLIDVGGNPIDAPYGVPQRPIRAQLVPGSTVVRRPGPVAMAFPPTDCRTLTRRTVLDRHQAPLRPSDRESNSDADRSHGLVHRSWHAPDLPLQRAGA